YAEMVETSPVETHLVEYRLPHPDRRQGEPEDGRLVALALVDVMSDGLSMVYSFFAPDQLKRSLGAYVILDHVRRVLAMGKSYIYLGYWVENSRKMAYKTKYAPLERLTPN